MLGLRGAVTKLLALMGPADKRGALVLILLMGVGMALEMAGVGLVIPALAVLSQPDVLARYPAVGAWLPAGWLDTRGHLVMAAMGALVGLFLVKNLFLAYLYLHQARFVYLLRRRLMTRLFTRYLAQPYAFHLQRNPAELTQTLMGTIGTLTGVLTAVLGFFTEALVLLGIALLLLWLEPLASAVVFGLLGVVGWAFLAATRRRLNFWGGEIQRHETRVMQTIQQGLGGIKELKVLGREALGLERFDGHAGGSARGYIRVTTYPAYPRLGLELMAVLALAGLVWSLVLQGRPLDTILPTLGMFAAGAFRVMPSFNRLVTFAQGLQSGAAAVERVYQEFQATAAHPQAEAAPVPLPFQAALTLEEVSFSYPQAARPALAAVSLTIRPGESVGFIGTSGAGKSTLVDILLGLLPPEAGVVRVDGVDIQTRLRAWQRQIGYVPQAIYLADDTIRGNVALGVPEEEIDEAALTRALQAAQLSEFVAGLPAGLDTEVGERGVRLSGGQRQRIGIARALYHDPPVLVLDEATSALDTPTEQGVMAAVEALQGSKTILIIAHRLSTVAHCDRIYRLEQGRVVASGRLEDVAPA